MLGGIRVKSFSRIPGIRTFITHRIIKNLLNKIVLLTMTDDFRGTIFVKIELEL
jgi:hypothetical protein